MNITSHRICPACGEFLPHYCASLVLISRQKFTGKRVTTITDRAPADVTERAA